jgi:hypothetical protein
MVDKDTLGDGPVSAHLSVIFLLEEEARNDAITKRGRGRPKKDITPTNMRTRSKAKNPETQGFV